MGRGGGGRGRGRGKGEEGRRREVWEGGREGGGREKGGILHSGGLRRPPLGGVVFSLSSRVDGAAFSLLLLRGVALPFFVCKLHQVK